LLPVLPGECVTALTFDEFRSTLFMLISKLALKWIA
jgi:hypothetical protein